MIYLDNAATTYPKPNEVYDALDYAQRNLSFNAGRGSYKQSKDCMLVLEELRKEIASMCNSDCSDVALLSSATEALNVIINGLDLKDGMNVYITPFEHNAIIRPLYNIKKYININIQVLPFNKETWQPELAKIENMFALNNPAVVFSSQISNVTGLIVDYSPIFEIAKRYESKTVLDAAQGFGIVSTDTKYVDFLVFAGHKSLYGPFGIGGFVNQHDIKLKVVKSGGTGSDTLNHEMADKGHERYEAGSFNVPAVYGTIASIKWLKRNDVLEHSAKLTSYLIKSLRNLENVSIFTPQNPDNILGIVSIAVDGYSSNEVGNILYDEFGICVRTGYHCAPLVHSFIGSLASNGTVRFSLGFFNTLDDVDYLIDALKTL